MIHRRYGSQPCRSRYDRIDLVEIIVKYKLRVKRLAVALAGLAGLVVVLALLVDPAAIERAKDHGSPWVIVLDPWVMVLYVVLANILALLVGIGLYWLWRWIKGGSQADRQ